MEAYREFKSNLSKITSPYRRETLRQWNHSVGRIATIQTGAGTVPCRVRIIRARYDGDNFRLEVRKFGDSDSREYTVTDVDILEIE